MKTPRLRTFVGPSCAIRRAYRAVFGMNVGRKLIPDFIPSGKKISAHLEGLSVQFVGPIAPLSG